MTDILFRGKQMISGSWVEGDLFHNDNELFPMTMIGHIICSRNKHDGAIDLDGYDLREVDPETVGQYTGLVDKNGKRIFEGDVLSVSVTGGVYADFVGEVYFENGVFMISNVRSGFSLLAYRQYCTVIGNIHDNPELLR